MREVYVNHIAAAVPDDDMHRKFVDYVPQMGLKAHTLKLFSRMADRAQIDHRYSVLSPHPLAEQLDAQGFYQAGHFPDTQARMVAYQMHAVPLALKSLGMLEERIGYFADRITHLIIISCTGFYAPGLDLDIVRHLKLNPAVERQIIGFMGCYAAINGLKAAWHIVRAVPESRVLMINLELCTLHFNETENLEELLSFLLFADGCAASLISSQPEGLRLKRFYSCVLPDSEEQITWKVGNQGFDMHLSGQVPNTIGRFLSTHMPSILNGDPLDSIAHWAIHPGGRSVLDAVEGALGLPPVRLEHSRQVLREYGNMSSATLMFVLKAMMETEQSGEGCAMAFGPGVTVESMRFSVARKRDNGIR